MQHLCTFKQAPDRDPCGADARLFLTGGKVQALCSMHAPVSVEQWSPDDPTGERSAWRDVSADGTPHRETLTVGSRAWMAQLMDDLLSECRAVREQAQREYAHDEGNAFGNFDRVGLAEGLRPDQVLRIYFRKHLDGIVAHFNGVEAQREPIKGRFVDAITYLCLLYGLAERARLQAEQGA